MSEKCWFDDDKKGTEMLRNLSYENCLNYSNEMAHRNAAISGSVIFSTSPEFFGVQCNQFY